MTTLEECWMLDMLWEEYAEMCIQHGETPLNEITYYSKFDSWNDMREGA